MICGFKTGQNTIQRPLSVCVVLPLKNEAKNPRNICLAEKVFGKLEQRVLLISKQFVREKELIAI